MTAEGDHPIATKGNYPDYPLTNALPLPPLLIAAGHQPSATRCVHRTRGPQRVRPGAESGAADRLPCTAALNLRSCWQLHSLSEAADWLPGTAVAEPGPHLHQRVPPGPDPSGRLYRVGAPGDVRMQRCDGPGPAYSTAPRLSLPMGPGQLTGAANPRPLAGPQSGPGRVR